MKITSLSLLSFGKFKNKTFEINPDIHVFYGHNEAGKTTLIHFIEGMLYGFYDPFKKGRRTLSIYDRYLPSDGIYQGTLELEKDGVKVRLERDFKNHQLKVFSVKTGEDITDQLPYDTDIKQADIGAWLDLPYALYQNTIRISQSDLMTSSGAEDELFRRLSNLNQTKSISFSGDEALKYLKDLKDEIGTPKSPTKPYAIALSKRAQLEAEKETLETLSLSVETLERNLRLDQETLENLTPRYEALKKQKEEQHKHHLVERIIPLKTQYQNEYQAITTLEFKAYFKALSDQNKESFRLIDAPNLSVDKPFMMLDAESHQAALKTFKMLDQDLNSHQQNHQRLTQEIEALVSGVDRIESTKPPQKPHLTWTAIFIVPLLIFLFQWLGYFIKKSASKEAYHLQEIERINQKIKTLKGELKALEEILQKAKEDVSEFLKTYHLSHENALVELYQLHQLSLNYQNQIAQQEAYEAHIQATLKNQKDSLDALHLPHDFQGLKRLSDLIDLKETITLQCAGYDFFELMALTSSSNQSFNLDDLREVEDQRLSLIQSISRLEANIQSSMKQLSGYESLRVELSEVSHDISLYEERLSAINKAEKLLEKSIDIIEENFAPALSEAIEKHLKRLTLGRYEDVKIRKSLAFKVSASGFLKEAIHFSTATLDQIHLAIRLGMMDVLGLKHMPLLLDDAFMHFDALRLEAILKEIGALKTQRLLFTAHQREEETLKKLGVSFERTQLHD